MIRSHVGDRPIRHIGNGARALKKGLDAVGPDLPFALHGSRDSRGAPTKREKYAIIDIVIGKPSVIAYLIPQYLKNGKKYANCADCIDYSTTRFPFRVNYAGKRKLARNLICGFLNRGRGAWLAYGFRRSARRARRRIESDLLSQRVKRLEQRPFRSAAPF